MLKCLICGKEFKSRLSPHIVGHHKISCNDYKKMFGNDVILTSNEFKERLNSLNRGLTRSQDVKDKISNSRKGVSAWNKGLTIKDSRVKKYADSNRGNKRTFEQRMYISSQTVKAMSSQVVKDKLKSNYKNLGVVNYANLHNELSSKEFLKAWAISFKSKNGRKPTYKDLSVALSVNVRILCSYVHRYCLEDYFIINDSPLELYFEDILRGLNLKYKKHNRSVLQGLEIDFYLPEYKIGIEINDIASHNSNTSIYGQSPKENNYHQMKYLLAEEFGVHLIHIYEWELLNESYIGKFTMYLKSLIYPSIRLYARKCKIECVSWKESKDFLDLYHLQGCGIPTKINYGLFYDGKLIELMTFGKSRFSKSYDYELMRLCTMSEYVVIGGANKLLNHFIKEFNPESIVSYSNNDTMVGGVYKEMNFSFLGVTNPTYNWVDYNYNVYNWKTVLDLGVDNLLKTNYGKGISNECLMLKEGFLKVYNSRK